MAWPSFEISLRHGSARYEIRVENPDGVGRGIAAAAIDGKAVMERPLRLQLADDGAAHRLLVRLGRPAAVAESLGVREKLLAG
jgi:cyclic beta-1,2-glucan synthetase